MTFFLVMCSGVFCWDHCYEYVPIKYLGIEQEQTQLLCVDCAREYNHLRKELEREQQEENERLKQEQQLEGEGKEGGGSGGEVKKAEGSKDSPGDKRQEEDARTATSHQ